MDKIISRVQKLLKQAEGTPYEAEASSAMLLAQKLMVKHGLSASDINEGETKGVIDFDLSTGRHAWWKKSLARLIADNFRCANYNHRVVGDGVSTIRYIGKADDVETASSVYYYAVKMITYHSGNYIKLRKTKEVYAKGDKNTYIMGYLLGLKDKFAKQVENEGWGLVLVKDDEIQKVVESRKLKKAKKTNASMSYSQNAYAEGYKRGQQFINPAGEIQG